MRRGGDRTDPLPSPRPDALPPPRGGLPWPRGVRIVVLGRWYRGPRSGSRSGAGLPPAMAPLT